MINHILLFKFKEGVSENERADAVLRLEALGPRCPTVLNWVIGVNQADSPSAYDLAEVATFGNEAGLDSYKEHSAHRELSEHMATIATWALVDHNLPL
jgi:hypothetical protein